MVAADGPFVRPRSGRRLVALFGITILLPALLLAALGARTIRQERRIADQQLRERIERAADLVLLDIEREVRSWQSAVEQFASSDRSASALPPTVRSALSEPGSGVILSSTERGPVPWPEQQILYSPRSDVASPDGVDRAFSAAEAAELRDGNQARALELYRQALAAATTPQVRAAALHRTARTLRKLRRDDDALAAYRQLSTTHEWIGAVPADLIARYEICAILAGPSRSAPVGTAARDLYNDLVDGRWRLEKSRYFYYSAALRALLAADRSWHADAVRLARIEERKTWLTEAAIEWLDHGMVRATGGSQRFVVIQTDRRRPSAMLLSTVWLAEHVWPRTVASTLTRGFDVTLTASDGRPLFATRATRTEEATSGVSIARMLDRSQTPWRVTVTPRDPAALAADVSRRQTVYLIMLGLVVALLGSGSYLTLRVVRREIEIARLESDFVSTVSHEFRSPLTGIRQLGELLARGRVPSEARRQQYYEHIVRESDRLTRLVENVLDFARMDRSRREYRIERLDTSRWLRAIVDEARSVASKDGPRIVATIPEPLPPVDADPAALACAVHNLIDNAVKYSPGREAVWVDAAACDGHVAIRVRDEGVGIGDDDRRHIFDRFYRTRAEISREVKGAGLGLTLVAHIVHAHGGTVSCNSRLGEGSTFAIHLKAADSAKGG
jgi:signal transduction histidine kinase